MGGEFGLPIGQTKDTYDYTAGFSMKIELSTGVPPLRLIGNLAYNDYVAKLHIGAVDANYLPVEVGLKVYIQRLYLEGLVGGSVNLNSNFPGQRIGLIYSPGIGYAIPSLDYDELDFGVRYDSRVQTGGNLNQVVLRVAYKFNL